MLYFCRVPNDGTGCSPIRGVRLAGGNANNGANAGACNSNTNNAASNSNANISAPQYFYFKGEGLGSCQKIAYKRGTGRPNGSNVLRLKKQKH